MKALGNAVSPRYYNTRVLQLTTWAVYGALTLSACLVIWLLLTAGLQWRACLSVASELSREQHSAAAVQQEMRTTKGETTTYPAAQFWLSSVADLAARMEFAARRGGVTLLSVSPESGQEDVPKDDSLGDGFPLQSQKVRVRAQGPYAGSMTWIRWLAGRSMPVKIDSLTVAPGTGPNGTTVLSVNVVVTMYSRQKPEGHEAHS